MFELFNTIVPLSCLYLSLLRHSAGIGTYSHISAQAQCAMLGCNVTLIKS